MNKTTKIVLLIVLMCVVTLTVLTASASAVNNNNNSQALKIATERTASSVSGTILEPRGDREAQMVYEKHLTVEVYDGFNRHEFGFRGGKKTFAGDIMYSVKLKDGIYRHYFIANLLPNKNNEISKKAAKIKVWYRDKLVYAKTLTAPKSPPVDPKTKIKVSIHKNSNGSIEGALTGEAHPQEDYFKNELYVQIAYKNKSKTETHWFNFKTNRKSHKRDKMNSVSSFIYGSGKEIIAYRNYFNTQKMFKGSVKKGSVFITVWLKGSPVYSKTL